MLAIYEDRQVFVVVPLSLDRRTWCCNKNAIDRYIRSEDRTEGNLLSAQKRGKVTCTGPVRRAACKRYGVSYRFATRVQALYSTGIISIFLEYEDYTDRLIEDSLHPVLTVGACRRLESEVVGGRPSLFSILALKHTLLTCSTTVIFPILQKKQSHPFMEGIKGPPTLYTLLSLNLLLSFSQISLNLSG